ncbi:hypothetical protein BASA81_017821 [Batrachochytrium salamandrivorans]|nr:hypothetical protein BASA81_017821 [Batrachochytrium salamandrivorans]
MTESAVAAFLYDLMMTYGAPFEIISDRGKSFLAEGIDLFEAAKTRFDTWLLLLTIHRLMGWSKEMHAMLGHGLTTLVHGKRDRWDERNRTNGGELRIIARNLEEVGQARSAANVRTKAQSEAMRKRGGFDENTPDYFFKVGDMVKMKHHERLKLELDGKVHTMWWMLDILGLTGS